METTVRYGRSRGIARKTDHVEYAASDDIITAIQGHIRALNEKIGSARQKAKIPFLISTPFLFVPQFFGDDVNKSMLGIFFAFTVFVVVDVNRYSVRSQNFMLVALSLPSLCARRKAWELELSRLRTLDHNIPSR